METKLEEFRQLNMKRRLESKEKIMKLKHIICDEKKHEVEVGK